MTGYRGAAFVVGLVCVAGGLACSRRNDTPVVERSQAEAQTKPAVAREPSDPLPDAKCRDFSSLDVSTLPALPATPHTAAFEQVWQRVLEKHYDPTIACRDWPKLRLEHGAKLASAKDADDAHAVMRALLAELGQSHFGLLTSAESRRDDRLRGPAQVPIHVRWIERRLVIVDSDVELVPRGSILVAIEDEPVEALIRATEAPNARESTIASAIARRAASELSCPVGGSKSLALLDPTHDDAQVTRAVDCDLPKGELVTLGNLHDMPTRVEHYMVTGTKVGVVAFNLWMLPMVERVRDGIHELRRAGMAALVLDLRGNPGGVGPMAVAVARMILDRPGSLGTLKFRTFEQHFNVQPERDPFLGPVIVLVDESTASTSEIFAAGLRDLGRVTVFGGRPSAGAALPSIIEELESGVVLQYVVGDYHSSKGTAVEGVGVIPDRTILEHRADFAAGRDPVLDAAVDSLNRG